MLHYREIRKQIWRVWLSLSLVSFAVGCASTEPQVEQTSFDNWVPSSGVTREVLFQCALGYSHKISKSSRISIDKILTSGVSLESEQGVSLQASLLNDKVVTEDNLVDWYKVFAACADSVRKNYSSVSEYLSLVRDIKTNTLYWYAEYASPADEYIQQISLLFDILESAIQSNDRLRERDARLRIKDFSEKSFVEICQPSVGQPPTGCRFYTIVLVSSAGSAVSTTQRPDFLCFLDPAITSETCRFSYRFGNEYQHVRSEFWNPETQEFE